MNYAQLIPLFPLIGFVVVALFGKRMNNEKLVGGIASTAILASFVIAVATFLGLTALPVDQRSFTVKVYSYSLLLPQPSVINHLILCVPNGSSGVTKVFCCCWVFQRTQAVLFVPATVSWIEKPYFWLDGTRRSSN